MLNTFKRFFKIGEHSDEITMGVPRSPKWEEVRKAFVKEHPTCAVCGSKKDLNCHHKLPFHINPALELDPTNLITLCRDHHFLFGHFLNWKSFNKDVEADSTLWTTKIENRP
jgi:5-methylcytosine-specific restriction enzyme A